MDTTKMLIVGNILTGVLLFLLTRPLIFRKVPMNEVYGIRIRSAFESDQRWYDINAYGGRKFAIGSWLIIFSGVTGFFIPPGAGEAYAWASLVAAALAVMLPVVLTLRWSRRH
jgi:hypothetical protein